MEDFDWTSFTLKIAINAKLKTIYDAWTKAEEIEKWFLSNSQFSDQNNVLLSKSQNLLKGDLYQWVWYLYDDVEHGRITEANGKNHLQFTFAGDCLVDVFLREEYEYVVVKLIQRNIPTDDESKRKIRLGCQGGWSFYLVNLKSVYEGGLDLRNKDNRFKPMLNN